jgi:putative ABC transport system permease protein
VAQRRRELGIMVALGAARTRIVLSVLREAVIYGAVGLALGLPSALAASRALRHLVFGVTPTDANTYLAIAATVLLTVVLTAAVPALRAARVDPAEALKA